MNAEIPRIGLSNMNNKMPIFMLIKKTYYTTFFNTQILVSD